MPLSSSVAGVDCHVRGARGLRAGVADAPRARAGARGDAGGDTAIGGDGRRGPARFRDRYAARRDLEARAS